MPVIDVQDQPIQYQVEGTGKSVLLLHGFCEDRRIWDVWATPFVADHQVITLDLPGFGESPLRRASSIADMAFCAERVLQAEQVEEVVIVGHSMGGYVALALAALTTARIRGLGLFHSHPFADGDDKKEARDKGIQFVKAHGVAQYTGPLIRQLFSSNNRLRFREVIDQLVERAAAYEAAGIINSLEAMRDRPDRSEVLRNAHFPVWFLVGDEDEAIPVASSRTQLALPGQAQIDWLEEVGHMGQFEARAETQQRFRQFLRHLSA